MKKYLVIGALCSLLIPGTAQLRAQTYTWSGATSSDWNTASNWNTTASGTVSTTVPGAGQNVDIGDVTAQTNINLSANDTIKTLSLNATSAQTFNITTGTGVTLTIDADVAAVATILTLRSSQTFNGSMLLTDSLGSYTPQIYLNSSNLTFGTSSSLSANLGFGTVNGSIGNLNINGGLTIASGKGITWGSNGILNYNPTTSSVSGSTMRVTTTTSTIDLDQVFAGSGITFGQYSTTGGNVYLSGTNMNEATTLTMNANQGANATFIFGSNSTTATTNTQSGAILLSNGGATTGFAFTNDFDVAANNTLNVSGLISGTLSVAGDTIAVEKTSSGTLKLSQATGNTYVFNTNIVAGTLLAANTSGSATGTGAVAISGGAILAGTGIITGAVTASAANSIIAPGLQTATGISATTGTLTLSGGLTATSGLTFDFNMDGVSATSLLTLNGGFAAAGGTLTFNVADLGAGTIAANTVYTLISGTSGTWTSPTSIAFNTLPSGWTLNTAYGTNGYLFNTTNDTFTVEFATVPEPSPIYLLGLSLLAGGAMVLRRRMTAAGEAGNRVS